MTETELSTESMPRADAPGLGTAQVTLKPRKSRPFYGRHPWVLESAVDRVDGNPADGNVVELLSEKGKFIARGIINSHSRIRVRLYTWDPSQPLDDSFWRERLESALALRRGLGYSDPRGAARLVFSEADALSGLVVDRYGEYLVIQVTSLAMLQRLDSLVPVLQESVAPRGIVARTERGLAAMEGIDLRDERVWGQRPDGPVFIEEHGIRYGVDFSEGQKTGFYIDQRENRRAAASYMHGRRVLDMFCYSGGFSLAASILGGAREVLGVDTSSKAVALAKANAELNGVANVHFEVADAFKKLDELVYRRERFEAVVLDPPKFAGSRKKVDDALMAYHRINRTAVDLLEPGGILVTCSCSGHVTREDFLHMLSGVAQRTGRQVQVLEQRGPSADHPVSATCLETEYLKCFICRVV